MYNDVKAEFTKIAPPEWVENHVKSVKDFKRTVELNDHVGVLFMTYRQLRKSGGSSESNQANEKTSMLSGMEIIQQFFAREKRTFSGVVN